MHILGVTVPVAMTQVYVGICNNFTVVVRCLTPEGQSQVKIKHI